MIFSGGTPATYSDHVLFTLQKDGPGTLLASTQYVWYGKVTARLTASAGVGIVTDFILVSDSRDEIDFEMLGVELESAQTAYYVQGHNVADCRLRSYDSPIELTMLQM